jgi:PAS domain S-box-containing protein
MHRDGVTQRTSEAEARLQALLESTESLAGMGSWEWRLDDNEFVWSRNLYRLFGFEPGDDSLRSGFYRRVHPDDRQRVEAEARLMARSKSPRPPLEYRLVHPEDGIRYLRSSTAVIEADDGPRRIIGSVEDVTERRRAEREIGAHVAVADALSQWASLDQGGELLLQKLARAMGFEFGVLWVPQGNLLIARVAWQNSEPDPPDLWSDVGRLRLPRGVGMAGAAWELRRLVNVSDLTAQRSYAFLKSPARDGVRGALALPAIADGEVIAVLGFASREETELPDRLCDCLVGIGSEIGEFLSRRSGELGPPVLTSRELEVLQLAANGDSGAEIAERLIVSPATVKSHFSNIYPKLGASGRAAAVAAGLRQGLIK